MCTVSYLPEASGGYMITSNRDEAPARNAIELKHANRNAHALWYPMDPAAGGSWFGVSDTGRIACLLNGAFEPFVPSPRYTHSRGQVLLGALSEEETAFDPALLQKTAPFTLVLAELNALTEYIWDGTALHRHLHDPKKAAFWSSVTLYPEDVRQWRRGMFTEWLQTHPAPTQEEIIAFHHYGSPEDKWNGFVMNRNEFVRTLSITSARRTPDQLFLTHADLLSDKGDARVIQIQKQDVETD